MEYTYKDEKEINSSHRTVDIIGIVGVTSYSN